MQMRASCFRVTPLTIMKCLWINGKPDYRMQKQNEYTKRWNDIYLFDNSMQLTTAMEDHQYARWLDPDRVPCYVKEDDILDWDQ